MTGRVREGRGCPPVRKNIFKYILTERPRRRYFRGLLSQACRPVGVLKESDGKLPKDGMTDHSAPICLQIVRLGINFSSCRSVLLFRTDHFNTVFFRSLIFLPKNTMGYKEIKKKVDKDSERKKLCADAHSYKGACAIYMEVKKGGNYYAYRRI